MTAQWIKGQWTKGRGAAFHSKNPANNETIWEGEEASSSDVEDAVKAAREAFFSWANLSVDERYNYLQKFRGCLEAQKDELALAIAKDTGKPRWESLGEVSAMIGKITLSHRAQEERCGTTAGQLGLANLYTRHRPHGVMAVFGPYNFPGHIPNGHIAPALLAGNTVVFKPSELTPYVAELTVKCWEKAGLPAGVLNLVQGGRETGVALARNPQIDGLLFTGSSRTGLHLAKEFAETPQKILALEMGGNNPLVAWDFADAEAAAYLTLQSAYITSGQRCTCARRLIIPQGAQGDRLLQSLGALLENLVVGSYDQDPEPFFGPVINEAAAKNVLHFQENLKEKGALSLLEAKHLKKGTGLVSPGLLEASSVVDFPDEECFGPLLSVFRASTFEDALKMANNTRYGLSAALLSDSEDLYQDFYRLIRAGIVNWNTQTTGASSAAPFGGLGISGNHRPSAYYAADYCSYPVASVENDSMLVPEKLAPGIQWPEGSPRAS